MSTQQIVKISIRGRYVAALARPTCTGVALKLAKGEPPWNAPHWIEESRYLAQNEDAMLAFMNGQVVKL
jgi:hypothetical protein